MRLKPSVFPLSAPMITRLPLRRLGAGERLSPPRGFPLTSLDLCRQAGVGLGAGKRGAEGVAGGGSRLDVGQYANSSGLRGGWLVSGSPGEPKHLSQSGSDGSSGSRIFLEPAFYWIFTVQQFLNKPPAFGVELLFLKNTNLSAWKREVGAARALLCRPPSS